MSPDIKFLIATFAMSMVVFFGGMWIGWAMRGGHNKDAVDLKSYSVGYDEGWAHCYRSATFLKGEDR